MNTAHFCLGLVLAFHCLLSLVEASEVDEGFVTLEYTGTFKAPGLVTAIVVEPAENQPTQNVLAVLKKASLTIHGTDGKYYIISKEEDDTIWNGDDSGRASLSFGDIHQGDELTKVNINFYGKESEKNILGDIFFRVIDVANNKESDIKFESKRIPTFVASKRRYERGWKAESAFDDTEAAPSDDTNTLYVYVGAGIGIGIAGALATYVASLVLR